MENDFHYTSVTDQFVSKMRSHIVICLLVGFAFASTNPGWKDNSEYVYKVRGRTLASLHEVDNQYSGIIFKLDLKIQPRPDEKLEGQISNVQYSQIHSHLEDGWNTEIRDDEISYKPLPVSNHPFQIEMKDGVIRDLIVNKDIPNWEANIIKSVISQFQLNTKGVDSLPSKLTALPEGDDNSAVFKTMEDTVTGKTETVYDIHPIPEYVLQSKPWLARHRELKGDGDIIEVVKHKNYSNNEELPLYHYGFGDSKDYKPGTNYMGYFFVRDSISRAILTGNLKRYTVQNSYTVNEIIMSPTLNNKQKGSVVSMVNVTLKEIRSKSQDLGDVPNPMPLGNLVYTYDNPKTGRVSQKRPYERNSDEDRYSRSATMNRIRRAIGDYDSSKDSSSSSSEEYYKRSHPQLKEAAHAPLLPYSTGYRGMSVKHDPRIDIKKSVHKMAQEIGNDLQDPEQFLRQNTLSKFTTMTSLIRLMDLQELKQVAIDLYSRDKDGAERDTWTAFRDAVAECGTGPALLTIQDWIQSGKVKEEEAAEIITTMTDAVREPTREYMKSYFDFIKKPKVQAQEYLYYSALLSYSNLVREVCVDRKESKRQYPVKSFGKFCTDEAQKDVEKNVIPYFTKQLHEAVSRADTRKIHAYIRALGNVGHQQILAAFEPYLEGEKQASQFQRLLMVIAMDKLTRSDPKVARSVLYKIYQNTGEQPKVRAAAVYLLMHTYPPADMLQRMASYTNIDTHEHVNAAVKSSIEYAAEFDEEKHYLFRAAAESAKPLLTKKNYGVQHGQAYLRSYVMNELKAKYHQDGQYFGNEEGFYPTGFRYSIHDSLGGHKRQLATLQAMVSSIDELIHVFKYQTSDYQKQRQDQQQNAQQQQQHKYSSLNIANLLNMKADEREQFESSIYSELKGAFYKFWSYDNRSMEQLPEEIRKFEEEMRNSKTYDYNKMTNHWEMALSFPTETGLPFLFTYDTPTAVRVEGSVKGEASPQLSSGGKLQKPDTISLTTTLGFTINSKIQSRLSFSTPFDGQQYICGFDKNFHMHVPLIGKFDVDVKNAQIKASILHLETHEGARLFHYSTWPYTSRIDITNFQPVSAQENTHYIKQENLRSFDKVYGKTDPGVAVRVQIEHEREFINIPTLSHYMQSRDVKATLWSLWQDASIHYGQINVQFEPSQASPVFEIRAGYQHKYITENKQSNEVKYPDWNRLFGIAEPKTRQDDLIDTIGSGIKSADVSVLDASVEFAGDKGIKYSFLGGVGKSNVHPKSRVTFSYKKISKDENDDSYDISLDAESDIPNTNGLDLSESLKTEPKADTTIKVTFGGSSKSPSKADFKFEWRRSEERKQYLMEQAMYQECKREMANGNYQLPACANMTMSSNLLDRVNISVYYENMEEEVVDTVKSVYDALKFYYYPTLEVDRSQGTGKENEIQFQARFDPDLRAVNISVKTKDHKSTIDTIEVEDWAQSVFVAHPVFHLRSRIYGNGLGLHTYRPICVIDKTYMSTFNNRTYPAPLNNYWTLLLQYVPKDARHTDEQLSVEEMLKSEPEHYAVLGRQHSGSEKHKEIKITLSSPKTEYKVVDITLSPSAQRDYRGVKANVVVNDKQVQVSDEQSHDEYDGYIQIYSLPNGEVKVEVRDAFYAIYDGYRMKLTVVNGKFRDSVRGLCGAFNDDPSGDFLTSENCIARDYEQFTKSYELEGSQGEDQRRQFSGRSDECVYKEVPLYANVISEQDSGRAGHSGSTRPPNTGTKFQTRYVENGGEVCFTIRPVPVCRNKNHQRGSIKKNVPVHCVRRSNVAQLWMNQIDKGASPDFSHKKESKTVPMELPQSCSQ